MGKVGWGFAIVGGCLLALIPKVGVALAIIWVLMCWALSALVRYGERIEQEEVERPQRSNSIDQRRVRPAGTSKDSYRPPAPSGELVEAWGPCMPYEVVGEAYYGDNISRLLAGVPGFRGESGAQLDVPATLVAAPDNPYGKGHAIAVWMGGQHVGYIASDDAARHFPNVMKLRERGKELMLDGRLWARRDRSRVYARATIWLPEPDDYEAPPAYLPEFPYVVLPGGGKVQVTREDEHMDALGAHVTGEASARSVAATLRMTEEIRPRSVVEAVEVSIQGERVGILSPTQTANLKPLVEYVAARDRVPVVRATVVGNQIKADVTLHVAKSHEVDQGWLDLLGDPTSTTADEGNWGD